LDDFSNIKDHLEDQEQLKMVNQTLADQVDKVNTTKYEHEMSRDRFLITLYNTLHGIKTRFE
jgi:hypothetical protein